MTRVQIPQVGPFPLRLTAGYRTLNAKIVVRVHEGEPNLSFWQIGPVAGRSLRDNGRRFCQQIKRLTEGGDDFAVLRRPPKCSSIVQS